MFYKLIRNNYCLWGVQNCANHFQFPKVHGVEERLKACGAKMLNHEFRRKAC